MQPHLILDCSLEDVGVAASLRELLRGEPARVVHVPTTRLSFTDASEHASVIISGSQASVYDERPWIPPLLAFLSACLQADVPMLGVCFGHQAIARALCGPGAVRRALHSELGWAEIERRPGAPLLDELPPRFPCFVSHFDEVVPGLRALEVLARSERCPVHAYRVRGRRAFGVQFHPELPPSTCTELVHARLAAHAYLGADARAVLARAIDARPIGDAIFARFLALVAGAPLAPAPWLRRAG